MKHKTAVFSRGYGNVRKYKCAKCQKTWSSKYRNSNCPFCGSMFWDEGLTSRKSKPHYKKAIKKFPQGFGPQYPDLDSKGRRCPVCRKGTVKKRVNNNTGHLFLGCSNYPECSHTEKVKIKAH